MRKQRMVARTVKTKKITIFAAAIEIAPPKLPRMTSQYGNSTDTKRAKQSATMRLMIACRPLKIEKPNKNPKTIKKYAISEIKSRKNDVSILQKDELECSSFYYMPFKLKYSTIYCVEPVRLIFLNMTIFIFCIKKRVSRVRI